MKKKAQLKIQEMSFMLLAVVLFFVIAGLFFVIIKMSGLRGEAAELKEKEAISIAENLMKMPEFSYEKGIDTDKLIALKGKQGKYGNLLAVNAIKIRKIYPEMSEDIVCTIGNYPNCNVFEVYDNNKKGINTPSLHIALCRKEKKQGYVFDKCELGVILIEYEEK